MLAGQGSVLFSRVSSFEWRIGEILVAQKARSSWMTRILMRWLDQGCGKVSRGSSWIVNWIVPKRERAKGSTASRLAVLTGLATTLLELVSWDEALGDGKWAAKAEGARGDLEAGGGLFALVFVAIDEGDDVTNEFEVEAGLDGDLLRTFHFFNIGFQDAVQNLVRRQRVGVLLIWTQFGGGRFLEVERGISSLSRLM